MQTRLFETRFFKHSGIDSLYARQQNDFNLDLHSFLTQDPARVRGRGGGVGSGMGWLLHTLVIWRHTSAGLGEERESSIYRPL